MPKYKVSGMTTYPTSAVITAPNLESAVGMAEDIDGAEFVQEDNTFADTWVYSLAQVDKQQENIVMDTWVYSVAQVDKQQENDDDNSTTN